MGIDSSRYIQALMTPNLQSIKKNKRSLLHKKLNFLKKRLIFLNVHLQASFCVNFNISKLLLRSDRCSFPLHVVNLRLIAVTRRHSWSFIQLRRDNHGLNYRIIFFVRDCQLAFRVKKFQGEYLV